jgi:hypothetical protein
MKIKMETVCDSGIGSMHETFKGECPKHEDQPLIRLRMRQKQIHKAKKRSKIFFAY